MASGDLVNTNTIAERFGISRHGVQKLRERHPDFPPVAVVDDENRNWFAWMRVRAWAIDHNRWDDTIEMPVRARKRARRSAA